MEEKKDEEEWFQIKNIQNKENEIENLKKKIYLTFWVKNIVSYA